MRTGKAAVRRLTSQAGDSLAEVLVALLVAAVGIMLLAGMINASSSLTLKSKSIVQNYVSGEAQMIKKDSGSEVGTGSVTLKNTAGTKLKLTDDNSGTSIDTQYYENGNSIGNTTVVIYD